MMNLTDTMASEFVQYVKDVTDSIRTLGPKYRKDRLPFRFPIHMAGHRHSFSRVRAFGEGGTETGSEDLRP